MKRNEAVAEDEMVEVADPLVGVERVEEEDSKTGFPEEYVEPLRGLLFLGHLSKNVAYAGHDFLIETLTESEVLRVGQYMSEYKGTFSEAEARKMFTVAACVQSVDGYALATPIMKDQDLFPDKVKVVRQWYPPVIDFVYKEYRKLEISEFSIANALKK